MCIKVNLEVIKKALVPRAPAKIGMAMKGQEMMCVEHCPWLKKQKGKEIVSSCDTWYTNYQR
jgi:hypothetical protein